MLNKAIKNTITYFWIALAVLILVSLAGGFIWAYGAFGLPPFDIYVIFIILFCAAAAAGFYPFAKLARKKRINEKIPFIYPLFILIITRIILLAVSKNIALNSDFYTMRNAALELCAGNLEGLKIQYFYCFPYLLPYVVLQSLLYKLFGSGLLAVQIFNIICTAAAAGLIYLIALKIIKGRVPAIFAALIYICLPSNALFTAVPMPEFVYTVFFLLAVYLFINIKSKIAEAPIYKAFLYALAAGTAVWAANLFKPFGIILVIAAVIYFLIGINKNNAKKTAVFIAVLPLTLLLLSSLQDFAAKKILGGESAKNSYSWSLFVGSNYAEKGVWNERDAIEYNRALSEYETLGGANSKMLERAKNRLKENGLINNIKLWVLKAGILHGADLAAVSYLEGMSPEAGAFTGFIIPAEIYYMLIIVLSCGLSLLRIFKKRKTPEGLFIIYLCLLGFTVLHMIAETQAKYHFALAPLFCILAVYEIVSLMGAAKPSC